MPEGPEIRRAADRIAVALEGKVVEKAEFFLPALKQHGSGFSGRRVIALETRGKALMTHFEHGQSIYSHNQLYGRWYVVRRDRYPSTTRSLRLALHTRTHSALLYSASEIAVLPTQDLNLHPFLARIGPDILSTDLHWRDVARRINSDSFRGRSLAALYLDQRFLAGIGNYLRSEILFDAEVNPASKPKELAQRQRNQLGRSTLEISRRAYETGGITNPPRRVAGLKKQGQTRRQYRHAVFGRNDQPCYRCQEFIIKDLLAGRRLYWCPICQY